MKGMIKIEDKNYKNQVRELMFIDENGNKHILENATITSITEENNNDEFLNVSRENFINNRSFSIDIQTKNMSEKRFKKKLMSKGIGRNGAEELARYFYKKYGCYNEINTLFF